MIPKIIHYCWFGDGELPPVLQRCIDSWNVLIDDGYQIMRWDESNCSFDENDFVKQCYKEKRWGYIGDYYRLKAIYTVGGVYLDTDILINKPFASLLSQHCFMGFSTSVTLCTAVIGAEKGNPFVKGLLDMYDTGNFITYSSICGLKGKCEENDNPYLNGKWLPSNEYWTWYTIKRFPEFKLNNKIQNLQNEITIYPKGYFEFGKIIGNYYCTHLCTNSWKIEFERGNLLRRILRKVKRTLEKNRILGILIREILTERQARNSQFYKYKKMTD